MKLYYFPVAPNPTKVRLYLAEKRAGGAQIEIEEELVNLLKGEQRGEVHKARNPLGRLPVLELDDGSYLNESLSIIEYFEELHPDPPMIGTSPVERARQRELERLADFGVLFPIGMIVHATNSPVGYPPNADVATRFRKILPGALSVLNDTLSDGRPFLAGERPTVADCTLEAALQFGRFGSVELPPWIDHIHRWDEAFRKRPSAQEFVVR